MIRFNVYVRAYIELYSINKYIITFKFKITHSFIKSPSIPNPSYEKPNHSKSKENSTYSEPTKYNYSFIYH